MIISHCKDNQNMVIYEMKIGKKKKKEEGFLLFAWEKMALTSSESVSSELGFI